MSKETFIQYDSSLGKNFVIEKKIRGERVDAFIYPEGGNPKNHDHAIIKSNYGTYIDRGVCKK